MNEQQIDNVFMDVYRSLSAKQQRKAMNKAMRREAGRVRKEVIANLRTATAGKKGRLGKGTRQDIAKGVYVRTYPERYGTGFMVSVKPHGARHGIHTNRRGFQKPVLMWAEDGTRHRNVGRRKQSFFSKSRWTGSRVRNYHRSGHSTGRMPAYGFMAKAERDTSQGVEGRLFADFQKNVEDTAARMNK